MNDEAKKWWEKLCSWARRYRESQLFPRKCRVLVNLLLIAFIVGALYVMLGGPSVSVTADYRTMERAHLVGPAQILGIEEVDFSVYDHLLVAEDEEGVILYACASQMWNREEHLVYREKKGDITVLIGPAMPGSLNRHADFELPVVVFDSHPKAVRAKVEIVMPDPQANYVLDCRRGSDGYFIGAISYRGRETGQGEINELQRLADISNSTSGTSDDTVFPVSVWLYDESGTLIGEELVELCSVAYENLQERRK